MKAPKEPARKTHIHIVFFKDLWLELFLGEFTPLLSGVYHEALKLIRITHVDGIWRLQLRSGSEYVV